jgi:hypothetical protein
LLLSRSSGGGGGTECWSVIAFSAFQREFFFFPFHNVRRNKRKKQADTAQKFCSICLLHMRWRIQGDQNCSAILVFKVLLGFPNLKLS